MNTKQMVALWYTGLAAVMALVIYADSVTAYSSRETFPVLPVLACILIIGGLLIGTFRSAEEVDSKKVLLYSLGPPAGAVGVLFGIGLAMTLFSEEKEPASVEEKRGARNSSQLVSKVEIVNPCLRFEDSSLREGKLAILGGRVRNQAEEEIKSVTINVQLHKPKGNRPVLYFEGDGCSGTPPSSTDSVSQEIDGHIFRIDVDVPPQATRSFTSETGHSSAPTMRPPGPIGEWEWTYELASVSTSYN